MMSLWDALRMNMMISYQELVRTFLSLIVINHKFFGRCVLIIYRVGQISNSISLRIIWPAQKRAC
ncbi:hypothetical protein B8O09_06605 [Klebsiella pneumoniae]|nr:hypothetical protein B8O09_06605 [Klebsiella pneumoniae]